MDGRAAGLRGKLACRCIVVETTQGLVLFDTGLGLLDVASPAQRLSRYFLRLLDPEFREALTAARQLERLGFAVTDVRHIVLTHLDFDHAGGLDDFPAAKVHLLRTEAVEAAAQRSWLDRQRYRPQQWSSLRRWIGYTPTAGAPWFGFDAVRELDGLPPEILMVPLPGHTLGHAGIAVREPDGWLLLAGDAYFDHDELDLARPRCKPGLRVYQTLLEQDRQARLVNQQRLRDLRRGHGGEVRIVCSHDPRELELDTGRALEMPVLPPRPDTSPLVFVTR